MAGRLIHCLEGKDRTGIVTARLCLVFLLIFVYNDAEPLAELIGSR